MEMLRSGRAQSEYWLDYGLEIGVRFSAEVQIFSLHHRVQTASGAHPASYPMGTGASLPRT
jgi:hypothetical protein